MLPPGTFPVILTGSFHPQEETSMNLRKIIMTVAVTALIGFGGFALLDGGAAAEYVAGANHWTTDTDVG